MTTINCNLIFYRIQSAIVELPILRDLVMVKNAGDVL